MIVCFNGEYLPKDQVHISPDDRGFLFADGVYEVIASYDGRLFEGDAHIRRLSRSLRELSIHGCENWDWRELCVTLLSRNGLLKGNAKVYLQITRGVAPRSHAFPHDSVSPTVYATASSYAPPRAAQETGVNVILVPDTRWARCDIKSIALLPNVLAAQRAAQENAFEAVFVRDGMIMEGSHTSVCAVVDGQLQTAPESNTVLPSITRQVVLRLCRDLDIQVREFPIIEDSLKNVDELMLAGTTTEVMPVVSVDGRWVGTGKPGPVTRRLQAAFRTLIEAG